MSSGENQLLLLTYSQTSITGTERLNCLTSIIALPSPLTRTLNQYQVKKEMLRQSIPRRLNSKSGVYIPPRMRLHDERSFVAAVYLGTVLWRIVQVSQRSLH
jgi:hypothetical protein